VAGLHVGDEVVRQGGIGDVVHQDAVVAIVLGAVAGHGQLAALHQRVAGAGAAGDVGGDMGVGGGHGVHAVAQVLHQVVIYAVAVGGLDIDAVAGFADAVAGDHGVAGEEQVDAVAAVLGAHRRVAFHPVVENAHVARTLGADAEADAPHLVVAHHHVLAAGFQ